MARYIDANWIYQMVEDRYRVSSGIEHRCERDLLDLICQAPTADVAPKSEVIQDILSLIDNKIRYEVEIYNSFISARHSKTLCQERVNAMNDIKLIINHQFRYLPQKKYTEDKT